jgi:thiamine-phosphate pyrophosphorylase
MILNKLKKYIFIKNLNEEIKKNIKKLSNVEIIVNNIDFNDTTLRQILEIQNFCQKNKIPFYIVDNYKIALKFKAQGVFISSGNKRMILTSFFYKKFKIIGSAHNQLEYFFKKKQQCETITLSPIFFNPKYSKNKILNPIKFNLISKNWNTNLCALGGILEENIKKINLTKVSSIAFQRLIFGTKKNPPSFT